MWIFNCCKKHHDYAAFIETCICDTKTITNLVGDNLHECRVCRKLHRCTYIYYCNFCTSKQQPSNNVVSSCYFCGFKGLTLTKTFSPAIVQK